MRVILDTNVLISGIAHPRSAPKRLLDHWYDGRFFLLVCEDLFAEPRRVSRYAKLEGRYPPAVAGRIVMICGMMGCS